MVKQFNLQTNKVDRTKDIGTCRRNEVAYRLYLLGKSTLLDLNASIAEKDSSQRAYISEMHNYWNLYYAAGITDTIFR